MEARINSFIFTLVCVAGLLSFGFAEETIVSPETGSGGDVNEAIVSSFPYVAEITGDNVYIRSGPGGDHYPTGKLNKGAKVTVVDSESGWSRIVPPPGSFSWISKQYVRIEPDNADTGTVTGNAVRVYVGSDSWPLMRSASQLKLDRGEKVKLLGEQEGGYYKIAPPVGAYRWVSSQYTRPVAPIVEPPSPPAAGETGPIVDTVPSVEAAKLQEYYAVQKQMEGERVKPANEQDYANIKKALRAIAENGQAGKAARYSQFSLKQIERFELALEVAKTARLQDNELERIIKDIESARARRLAEVEDLGRFAAVGRLEISRVFAEQTYQIIDDAQRIVCYALPSGKMDLSNLVGEKVGLVGTIEAHLQTGGALVRFTEAVELK